MQNHIKVQHNFIELASKGFIKYLDKLFIPFSDQFDTFDKFPIMIKNTGDEVYLSNVTENKQSETIYSSVPRLSMTIGGIGLLSGQLTAPYQMGKFTAKNEDTEFNKAVVSQVRRIPIEVTFTAEAVFDHILQYLTFVEIMLTVSFHNHYFTFYYGGNEYSGTFLLQEDMQQELNFNMQFDTDRRNRTLPLTFVLQLQFPAYDIYQRDGWNKYHGNIIDASDTMLTLVHQTHIDNDSPEAIVSTQYVKDKSLITPEIQTIIDVVNNRSN